MSKLDNFRKILAMPEVIQNVELTNQLKDLYTDYLELLDKNHELNSKLKEIGDISEIKKKAKVNSGFYTLDGVEDINGEEICFCLNCLYEYGLQIPMTFGIIERGLQNALNGRVFKHNVYGWSCNKCGTNLAVDNRREK